MAATGFFGVFPDRFAAGFPEAVLQGSGLMGAASVGARELGGVSTCGFVCAICLES